MEKSMQQSRVRSSDSLQRPPAADAVTLSRCHAVTQSRCAYQEPTGDNGHSSRRPMRSSSRALRLYCRRLQEDALKLRQEAERLRARSAAVRELARSVAVAIRATQALPDRRKP